MLVITGFVLLAAVSAVTLWEVRRLSADLETQRALLAFDLQRAIDESGEEVVAGVTGELASALAALGGEASTTEQPSAGLSRGDTLSTLTGEEWSSGLPLTIDFADGTPRLLMVWSHWCPYCQQELPGLADLAAGGQIPEGTELVTITTSIDPTRGNPLEEYLAELQPEFPVLVDPDGTLSAQVSTPAFPYWVIIAGDGTVLGSATGVLPEGDPLRILQQLAELDG